MITILGGAAVLAGCASETQPEVASDAPPDYRGASVELLDSTLVRFFVTMGPTATEDQIADYADCAAARLALGQGYGFARHIRTNLSERAGARQGDAVYTLSRTLPPGLRTIDAEVVLEECTEKGIPAV